MSQASKMADRTPLEQPRLTATIRFSDVGPRKLTWTAAVPLPLSVRGLTREIRKHQALGSREIDFSDDGGIYVGMFRCVGSWEEVHA